VAPSHPVMIFSRVLRQVRRENDLSQEALAATAGLHRNHISDLERAQKNPSLSTLIELADALGMTAGELMSRFDEERARQYRSAG